MRIRALSVFEGVVYHCVCIDASVPCRPTLEVDRTETPTDVNPLGVKGAGETGTIASTPAVVNAVVDALAPLGITHVDMPLTPERVWQAMQQAR